MPKIRVLVVDDAVVIRRMVSEVVNQDPDFDVVGVASNGKIALQRIKQLNPDAITLDIEMPEMDGLETVREIRKIYKTLPVIMFSTLTEKGGSATLDALSYGATDYVTKPANVGNVLEGLQRLKSDLLPKLKIHCRHLLPSEPRQSVSFRKGAGTIVTSPKSGRAMPPQILCIGTSTGGPNALAELVSAIPMKLSVPTVIVQHMPPVFTQMLAQRLDKLSPNACYEGEQGQLLEPGSIYIAPGGKHMIVERIGTRMQIGLNEEPPENSCRPAVDVLFRSVAACYGQAVLSVILTGMGQDGLNGSETVFEKGGRVIAQDEASSVVWGMPGYVAQSGFAEKVLPLSEIAEEIINRIQRRASVK